MVYYRVDATTYAYNGAESFTAGYDGAGNPTSYRGRTLTWTMGRELASYGGVTYRYNENGLRTYKNDGNGEWKYFWDGDRLFAEYANGGYIWYYYNGNGIQGMEYGGVQYYYMKNAFGDVIGIVDAGGNIVAKYAYDAWGVATIYDANGNVATSGIGYSNRIRYRGYYYDHESGLYYLQSRYYDPRTGRFISADNPLMIAANSQMLQGANLYSYCLNNPVMYTDEKGTSVLGTIGIILLIAVIGLYLYYAIDSTYSFNISADMDVLVIEWAREFGPLASEVEYGAYIYAVNISGKEYYFYCKTYRGIAPGEWMYEMGYGGSIVNGAISGYLESILLWVITGGKVSPVAFTHTHPRGLVHAPQGKTKFSNEDTLLNFLPGIRMVYVVNSSGNIAKTNKVISGRNNPDLEGTHIGDWYIVNEGK